MTILPVYLYCKECGKTKIPNHIPLCFSCLNKEWKKITKKYPIKKKEV